MDIHPSCRRLHKIPAHTVKELWSRPQRLPPCAPTFPSLRAAHYRPAYLLRQHLFQGRFTEVKRCCRCRFVVCPERLSSLRAAYYVRLFVSVNTFFRRMLPSLRVGVHRGEDRVTARERILKTSENSSRLFVDLFHRRVINACCSSTRAAARALRVLPQAC